MMVPRFKGKPNFDFSQACRLCGYKIQPNELMRLASHTIQCPKCSGVFDEMESKLAEIRRCTHRRPLGSAEFVQARRGDEVAAGATKGRAPSENRFGCETEQT
jgi:hypothetical protein